MKEMTVTRDGKRVYQGYVPTLENPKNIRCAYFELDMLKKVFCAFETMYEPKYDQFTVFELGGSSGYEIFEGEDIEVKDGVWKHLYAVSGFWREAEGNEV